MLAPIGWPREWGWGPVPQPGGQQAELFEERRWADGGVGLALIRDGNGTRSFETLLRYRGAAMAEFWRALGTLKALQAEQAAQRVDAAAPAPGRRPAARATASPPEPNEPARRAAIRLDYLMPDRPAPGATLHEGIAPWTPRRPDAERTRDPARSCLAPNEPEPHEV